MVNNPDLHGWEMKRKINKNIGSEDLCQPGLFDTPCHNGKNQKEERYEKRSAEMQILRVQPH